MKISKILLSLTFLISVSHSHGMTLPVKPIPADSPTSLDWKNSSFHRPLIKISIYSIALGLTGLSSLMATAQTEISQVIEQSRSCEDILQEWELNEPSISSSYDPSTPASVYTPIEVKRCDLTPKKRRPRTRNQENTSEAKQKIDPANLDCESILSQDLTPEQSTPEYITCSFFGE